MTHRLVEKQVVYRGKKVQLELHHLENTETHQRHTREVCAHPGAVLILGLLGPAGADQKVVLIRNYRYTIGQYLYELPAGTLEKGEDPMHCAGREMIEETGYVAGRLAPLMTFFTSPGILSEKMYVFTAYDLQQQASALEEGEDIVVEPVTLDRAIEMVRDGLIQDSKTIAALMFYHNFRRESH